MNAYNSVITNMTFLSKDVVEITFKIENGQMDFTPGQFILVEVSTQPSVMRAYSVLDYNLGTNEIKIAVKKVENGEATTIIFNDFKVGMNIKLMGAMGNELIVNKSDEELVLVATGIGITPILCILNDLIASNYKGKVDFLYGARTLDELFYSSEIEEIAKNHENIKFIPVLSREKCDGVKFGYVTDIIKNMSLENKSIYMCSSKTVATSFKNTLIDLKFDINKFKCESA